MKIWYGYGSEHSMNLVMIGHFQDELDASKAKQIIEWLTSQLEADVDAKKTVVGGETQRYTEGMLKLLTDANINNIDPAELEQFAFDVHVEVKGKKVVITTDEIDISAYLKVLLDNAAHVEVFSAHDYPDLGSEATT